VLDRVDGRPFSGRVSSIAAVDAPARRLRAVLEPPLARGSRGRTPAVDWNCSARTAVTIPDEDLHVVRDGDPWRHDVNHCSPLDLVTGSPDTLVERELPVDRHLWKSKFMPGHDLPGLLAAGA
jgi:hypothetical protein